MNKYEFTGETKVVNGIELHRIRALIDIGSEVKAGDLGGWVETEKNLSSVPSQQKCTQKSHKKRNES